MPIYEYKCHACGNEKEITRSLTDDIPDQLECRVCFGALKRRFSFAFTPILNEINSPAVGKHGSVRSYKSALDRHSDIHSQRTGMEVKYESFDPRDSDQDPTKPLK